MLKQASLEDITSGKISRETSYLVVCMHFYPRFLKKELRDEYQHGLAPNAALFDEFKAMQKKLGDHNVAFRLVKYEERFWLSDEASKELERLSELAREKDVYLICQCQGGLRCHRDLLLIYAHHRFQAEAEKPRLAYPVFEKRCAK